MFVGRLIVRHTVLRPPVPPPRAKTRSWRRLLDEPLLRQKIAVIPFMQLPIDPGGRLLTVIYKIFGLTVFAAVPGICWDHVSNEIKEYCARQS